MFRRVCCAIFLVLVCARHAAAQDDSTIAVVGSFTPELKAPIQFEEVFGNAGLYEAFFNGMVYAKATNLSIGVGRGTSAGGDWSVSFVHHAWKDGSAVTDVEYECRFLNVGAGCMQNGTSYVTRGVSMNGVSVQKFIPVKTIRQRVQIGGTIGGGMGWLTGSVDRHDLAPRVDFEDTKTGFATGIQGDTVTAVSANEMLKIKMLPLATLQLAVAGIVTPQLKVRAAWGVDYPGYARLTVSAVYLK